MLNTMVPGWIFLGIVLSFVPHDVMYGPQAALIAECFTPRLRYSGSSIGYQLASVVAGGPAPLLTTPGSGYTITGYIAFCAVVRSSRQPCCRITPTATSRRSTLSAVSASGLISIINLDQRTDCLDAG
jgi:hypothetical protein